MANLLDSVADLTDLRDKDALDVTLATVMFESVAASGLCLWRLVRHRDEIRIRERVRLPMSNVSIGLDHTNANPDDLPLLSSRAELKACYDAKLHFRQRRNDQRRSWRHVFPVVKGREVVSLLEITRSSPLTESQERLVFGLLRIYHNHLGILDSSDCDDLTGLLNRRTFDERFKRIVAPDSLKRARGKSPAIERRRLYDVDPQAYLAVVDIDFFKCVNDQFGHAYGDEVLVLLARLMSQCFRDTDPLFRFGGEEFVVILAGASQRHAEIALERFRAAVEAFNFPQIGRVTVSIGYTKVLAYDNGSNAFGRADEALYVAKRHGRNQLRCYETLIDERVLTPKPSSHQDVELF